MYRQFGSSALFLLLFTSAISHFAGPRHLGLAMRGSAAAATETSASSSAIDMDEHTCYVFEALRLFFGTDAAQPLAGSGSSPQKIDLPGVTRCTAENFAAIFPGGLPEIDARNSMALIATVPDPLQTSEALQFDRNIAALQEAASTAGYDFQWIATPWQSSDLSDSKDPKDAREVEHYREELGNKPGALLFRRRAPASNVNQKDQDALLLIVLVPESPIYGLNLTAGREGLNAIRVLEHDGFRTTPPGEPEDSNQVRWVGPSYSASAPGLRILRREIQSQFSFRVLSGTISMPAANAYLVQENRGSKQTAAAKATLSELDTDALCWFLGRESQPGLLSSDPIAVLQEDETAYGGNIGETASAPTPCSPLRALVRRFTFPRGISHLRGIYGSKLKNTASNPPQQAGEDTGSGTDVPLSFRDELADPMDKAPEFAPQSPVSNESVLAAIASDIKQLHARAIVIRTSDPLDMLFLARYFRQECPDSRVVLFNAERLLTRLRGDFNLDGTLVVTRFPLFQNAYLQTPFRGESRHSLTFANSREEAIFLAALLQIHSGFLPLLQSPYGHERFVMAPWIGVAAGGDFWPVAYLGEHPVTSHLAERNNVLLLTDTPPVPLPILWTLVLLTVLFLATLHFLFFLAGMPLHGWLSHHKEAWAQKVASHRVLSFYRIPVLPESRRSRLYTGQCWWLLNASTQFILLLAYLLLPVFRYQSKVQNVPVTDIWSFPPQTIALTAFTMIVLMLQFCMAGFLFYLLTKRCSQLGKGFFVGFETWFLPGISLLWVLLSLGLFLWQLSDAQTGFSFAARCLRLSSGVCPILPLLLTACSFLVASAVNLNALCMAITRNPGVPLLSWPFFDLDCWQKKLGGYTELWYGLPGMDGKLLAFAVFLACVLLHPQRLFATFDTPVMSWLYTFNFVLALWTVLWLWARFVRTWGVLRSGLDSLEGSPLRFAFSRLPAVFSIDPIWSYSGLRRVVVLPMRWFEYFKIAPKAPNTPPDAIEENRKKLRAILQETTENQWLDDASYTSFSHEQNDAAVKLSEMAEVRAAWRRGGPDCIPSSMPSAKPPEQDGDDGKSRNTPLRADVPSPCGTVFDDSSCTVEIGNEFIAMRVAAYIRYITLQMKNLMTFMSMGFLLMLLGAISYPFDKPQTIAWSATLILAALLFTTGTVLAQMDRDATLSRMSNTVPGQVRYMAFLKHMAAVGGLPLITVMATLFPSIGSFLFSWATPILETLH